MTEKWFVKALFAVVAVFIFSNNVQALECPPFSRHLTHLGDRERSDVVLCENFEPHNYQLVFNDGHREYFPIFKMNGERDLFERMKELEWSGEIIDSIKTLHTSNQAQHQHFLVNRQILQSFKTLNYANGPLSDSMMPSDPCGEVNLSIEAAVKSVTDDYYKMHCVVHMNEDIKGELGLKNEGNYSIGELLDVLKNERIILKSKVKELEQDAREYFLPQDFSSYELVIEKKDRQGFFLMSGYCRQEFNLDLLEKINETEKKPPNLEIPNPLDFKIRAGSLDLGFPVDVKIEKSKQKGSQKESTVFNHNGSKEESYDVDLDFGVSGEMNLGEFRRLRVGPIIRLPVARDVKGLSDALNPNNLSDSLIPREIGIRVDLVF